MTDMARTIAKNNLEEDLTPLNTEEIVDLIAHAADQKKAGNIVIFNIGDLTSFADYFVVCSAPSERQVQAIVRNVEDELRKNLIRPLGVEGLETSSWVLVDVGDVVFHCFTDSAREYYDLDGCWIDAERRSYP